MSVKIFSENAKICNIMLENANGIDFSHKLS